MLCKGSVSAAFCVAGAALGALQGVGCRPWRPLVSAAFCVAGAAFGALQGDERWRILIGEKEGDDDAADVKR